MTILGPALLSFLLAATHDVAAGQDVAAALARSAPGDVVRLGAGEHRAAIVLPAGVRLEGAGPERTRVVAPDGADALAASGDAQIARLALAAREPRCALVVRGGRVALSEVALEGGACGARVEAGALEAQRSSLRGRVGVRIDGGTLSLAGSRLRGDAAGVVVHGGRASLRQVAIEGPFREGAVSASGGDTALDEVAIRKPGPAGIAATGGATVTGTGVSVTEVGAVDEIPGACVQVRRATVRLAGGKLSRCSGAAVEAEGGTVHLARVDAEGGAGGCFALVGGTADLEGNTCTGRGPGLVLTEGARASLRGNRWRTDPTMWVDCGSGARAELGPGERGPAPCRGAP
jgi:hypothetical protein